MTIAAAILLVLTAYMLGGTLTIVTVAFISTLWGDDDWFNPVRKDRWTKGTAEIPPPILIFGLWPIVGIASGLWVMGRAWGKLTEHLATKLQIAATKHLKRMRGAEAPPSTHQVQP
jgi:hypothetical protein